MRLLVTMAVPKKTIGDTTDGYEGHIFERVRIEVLDWEKKEYTQEVD